jgi:hypothetical protein
MSNDGTRTSQGHGKYYFIFKETYKNGSLRRIDNIIVEDIIVY